jgi:lipid-binding SYLF domain-containing protein
MIQHEIMFSSDKEKGVTMRKSVLVLMMVLLASSVMLAESVKDRLASCGKVIDEIIKMPDGIPQELLDKASCVVVLPSVKKVAVVGLGGSYGKGALICRSGKDFKGPWGPPAMYRLEGGSFGFQLGGQATDFVMLIMNDRGMESLLSSKVKLGADASAAAGPKGRTAAAATDAWMRAEILTYSHTRGVFAGVSLEGSTLRQDSDDNKELYGKAISAKEILVEGKAGSTEDAKELVNALQKASPLSKAK